MSEITHYWHFRAAAARNQQEGRPADAATAYDRSIGVDEAIGCTDLHAESCRRNRAHVRAARGDFPGTRSDLKVDQTLPRAS